MAERRRAGRPGSACARTSPTARVQTALVSGGAGGPIGELAVGRSGLGDGLVAFQQGPLGNAAIVGAQVTAPPAPFAVTLPKTWIRPRAAACRVGSPPKARTGRSPTRSCSTAGAVGTPQSGSRLHVRRRVRLATGTHDVQLLATDIFGQADPDGARRRVKVDGSAAARARDPRRGRALVVRVSDSGSGVLPGSVSVSFGDGALAAKRRSAAPPLRAAPGRSPLYVTARDAPATASTIRRRVSAYEPARGVRSRSLMRGLCARDRRGAAAAAARADVFGRDLDALGEPRSARPNTPTTRRSPTTGATSSSTARSPACTGSGGAKPGRAPASNRSPAATPTLPSISADGRYVSFTTNEGGQPPGDHRRGDPRAGAPKARACTCATWRRRPGKPGRLHAGLGQRPLHAEPRLRIPGSRRTRSRDGAKYGAVAAGRSAISADGRTVAFVTTAQSRTSRARDAADAGRGAQPRQRRNAARQRRASTPRRAAGDRRRNGPATGAGAPGQEGRSRGGVLRRRRPAVPFGARSGVRSRSAELPAPRSAPTARTVAWYGAATSPNRRRRSAGERLVNPLRRAAVAADRGRRRRPRRDA